MDNIDKENMLGVLDNFWRQCEESLQLGKNIKVEKPVNGIIFCGMGGSSYPGEIIKGCSDINIPIEIVRDYEVPLWANKETLVFIITYSGNTEESLSCFRSAKARGSKIVCITSGGELVVACEKTGTNLVRIPSGIQPRSATGYMTIPVLNILSRSKIIEDQTDEIVGMVSILRKDVKENAKALAKRLVDKVPIIYTSNRLMAVARLWKAAINENAKAQAFFNALPEANHNEINGFVNKRADFYGIFIEDIDDLPRIKKRMEITKELMQEWECHTLILKLTGSNQLARMFSAILMGQYVGYYLALEYETDPTPVEMVEGLKKKLGVYIK
ncbi:MAG: bifunctional phosphoglucose/phosphomannose isomerase [Candidatus Woesearchaeota archaeon]|nr:bifunctional phosphoglucose/phosphomannose isomerase [Candidatus Woesearchaeota archaeon]